jgi:hypothetical protein
MVRFPGVGRAGLGVVIDGLLAYPADRACFLVTIECSLSHCLPALAASSTRHLVHRPGLLRSLSEMR